MNTNFLLISKNFTYPLLKAYIKVDILRENNYIPSFLGPKCAGMS